MAEPKAPSKPEYLESISQIPTVEQEALQPPDYTPWDLVSMALGKFNPMDIAQRSIVKKIPGKTGDILINEAERFYKLADGSIVKTKGILNKKAAQAFGSMVDKGGQQIEKETKDTVQKFQKLFHPSEVKYEMGMNLKYGELEKLPKSTAQEYPSVQKHLEKTMQGEHPEVRKASMTAIERGAAVTKPTKYLIDNNMLLGRVLHHGRGKAASDTVKMAKNKLVSSVDEFDPRFAPNRSILGKQDYDTVVSNYVLNVLPPSQRTAAINDIGSSLKATEGNGFITVRGMGSGIKGKPELDGFRTSSGTFQKPYTPEILKVELEKHFQNVHIVKGTDKSDMITARVSGWKKPFAEQTLPIKLPE